MFHINRISREEKLRVGKDRGGLGLEALKQMHEQIIVQLRGTTESPH